MPLFGAFSCGIPDCVTGLAKLDQILHTWGQIWPLFDDGPPGGPDGRCAVLVQGEDVIKSLQIFLVKLGVIGHFHVIRIGGTLGIDIEHQKAVETVVQGDTLH